MLRTKIQLHNYINSLFFIYNSVIPAKWSARLAQSVEHETLNLRVVGSSPTLGEVLLYLGNYRLL